MIDFTHADMPESNKLSGKPDRELVELLIGGSQEACGELYARFRERLMYFCKQYMNEADAKDIINDIFLQLWEKRHAPFTISSFSGYVHAMAKNLILKKFRHFDVHSRFARNILINETDATDETEHTILDNDYAKLLDELIERLPPKQKEIFQLNRIEGYTYTEISELLQTPVENVRQQISLALKKIKNQLLQHTDIHFQMIIIFLTFFL